jgi:hypothetical protein
MITKEVLNKAKSTLEAKAVEFAEKVQPFYVVMQWKWTMSPTEEPRIPTIKDIVLTVKELANSLKPDEVSTGSIASSTGGIQVSVISYPKLGGHTKAEISFIPVSVRDTVQLTPPE